MSMMKKLMSRPDTRVEVIGTSLAFVVIVVLALSGRKPVPSAALPRAAGPAAAVIAFPPWSLELLRLEGCSAARIVTAVIQVRGPHLSGANTPFEQAAIPGLTFDGGEWTGVGSSRARISTAGACGGGELYPLEPGCGLGVLRFRGALPRSPTPLSLQFRGMAVAFPAIVPVDAAPASPGLAGSVFSK